MWQKRGIAGGRDQVKRLSVAQEMQQGRVASKMGSCSGIGSGIEGASPSPIPRAD
jgi:hypothetical protein